MRELPSRDEPFFSIVFAGMRRPPIWKWPTFTKVEGALTRLIELAATPVAVRSVQADEQGQQRRFGRLSWASDSHGRWVLEGPGTDPENGPCAFLTTEIWGPSWTQCEKEEGAPLVFISLENPFVTAHPRDDQFNQLVQVALPVALFRHHSTVVLEALAEIGAGIDSALSVYRVAAWWHQQQSVQDDLTNHFNYVGRHQDAIPNLERLKTPWQVFTGTLRVPDT